MGNSASVETLAQSSRPLQIGTKSTNDKKSNSALTCDQALFFRGSAKVATRERQSDRRVSRCFSFALLFFRAPPKKERLIAG